jgi:hypothetical protein
LAGPNRKQGTPSPPPPPSPQVVHRPILAITGAEARQGGVREHEAGVGDSPEVKQNDGAHHARQSTAVAFSRREMVVRGRTGGR